MIQGPPSAAASSEALPAGFEAPQLALRPSQGAGGLEQGGWRPGTRGLGPGEGLSGPGGWVLEGAEGLGLGGGWTLRGLPDGRSLARSFARSDGRKIHPSVLKDIVPFGSAAQKRRKEKEKEKKIKRKKGKQKKERKMKTKEKKLRIAIEEGGKEPLYVISKTSSLSLHRSFIWK